MTGNDLRRVLDADTSLQKRLEQIPDDANGGDGYAKGDPPRKRHVRQPPLAENRQRDGSSHESSEGAFDGFFRTHYRRQRPPTKQPAAVILQGVARRNRENHEDRRLSAQRPTCCREQTERQPQI